MYHRSKSYKLLKYILYSKESLCFDWFLLYQISSKKYPKLKEVDDVLGGKEAWENVDSTEGK